MEIILSNSQSGQKKSLVADKQNEYNRALWHQSIFGGLFKDKQTSTIHNPTRLRCPIGRQQCFMVKWLWRPVEGSGHSVIWVHFVQWHLFGLTLWPCHSQLGTVTFSRFTTCYFLQDSHEFPRSPIDHAQIYNARCQSGTNTLSNACRVCMSLQYHALCGLATISTAL